jgi:hypothetical protein
MVSWEFNYVYRFPASRDIDLSSAGLNMNAGKTGVCTETCPTIEGALYFS